ncbi:MAG: HEAT repeat domain-containing protein, partial [Candidatus Woesearchaeota archaeon]|nr:HEAT repeat domain-containing protein [Candidatus Woesearchaeota archaeon]
LGHVGKQGLQGLKLAFDDPADKVRRAAFSSVGAIGGAEAVQILRAEYSALRGIASAVPKNNKENNEESGNEITVEKTSSGQVVAKDSETRLILVNALARMGAKASDALLLALDDPDNKVRDAAIAGLGKSGGAGSANSLLQEYRNLRAQLGSPVDTDTGAGRSATEFLVKGGIISGGVVAITGADVIFIEESKELQEANKQKSQAENNVRRLSIMNSLSSIGKEALIGLKEGLSDPDKKVLHVAVTGIGRINSAETVLILSEEYSRLRGLENGGVVQDDETRRLLLRSLKGAGKKALSVFILGLSDTDVTVRKAAFVGIGNVGGKDAISALGKAYSDLRAIAGDVITDKVYAENDNSGSLVSLVKNEQKNGVANKELVSSETAVKYQSSVKSGITGGVVAITGADVIFIEESEEVQEEKKQKSVIENTAERKTIIQVLGQMGKDAVS